MQILIKTLIIIFFFILSYQIFLAHFYVSLEGLENYREYDKNDPNNVLILAQQNAGNIEVLRKSIDDLSGVKQDIKEIRGDITNLNNQVDDLLQAQQSYLNENMPSSPPNITGAVDEKEEDPIVV